MALSHSNKNLAAWFVEVAQRHPEALALLCAEQSLTYEKLLGRASQVARALRGRGVGGGTPVGLAISRSLDSTIGLLGILLAGGIYVPIDPTYPQERQQWIAEDCGAQVMLTGGANQASVSLRSSLTGLAVDSAEVAGCAMEPLELPSDGGEALLCLLYTSGSTGRPKGVCVTQIGMATRLRWGFAQYPFAPGEVVAHRSSLNFVDSVTEVFSGLLQGVPTAIIGPEEATDLHRLVATLAAHRVTRLTLVPSLLSTLLRVFPDLGERLPLVSLWVSSGETLSAALLQRFRQAHPRATLLNLYGSTEVSADVTCAEFAPQTPIPKGRVPIGTAITGAELWVLDEQRQPVPAGGEGELYVGGPVLCRGYWRRPEEDRLRFVPHPTRCDERLFRTGDRVCRLPDGQLDYLGRVDNQVKVSGIRMELEEIEQAVSTDLPAGGMVAAVAVPSPADPEVRRLWLFCSPMELGVERLRQRASEKLPVAMVPSRFKALAELPLVPSGKIDRRALVAIAQRIETDRPSETVHLDADEQSLASLYSAVLGIHPVGPHDSLASLGGDSLAVAELGARLAARGGPQVPLSLLRDSSLAQIVRWLGGREPILTQSVLPRYRVVPATEVSEESLIHFACEVFVSAEPVCQCLQLQVVDLLPFYRALISRYRGQGLSLVALDGVTGELVGFSLAGDWTTQVPLDQAELSEAFLRYQTFLALFFDPYDRRVPKILEREMLDMAIAGAKPGIDGTELLFELDRRILDRAQSLGYRKAGALCLHRATALSAEMLGFVRTSSQSYATYEDNGQKILLSAAAVHKEAVFYTKELNPSPEGSC